MGPFIATVTSGEFDLAAFRFIQYHFVTPQSATFHNKATFDRLVKMIGALCLFDQNTSY